MSRLIVPDSKLLMPDRVFPGPLSSTPKRGMELAHPSILGFLPEIFGGAPAHGTHVAADVVTQTADGRDLNAVWLDFMALLNAVNDSRQALIRFLTFPVSAPVELVAQPGSGVDFEEATEFGEPIGARIAPTYWNMAYDFKWYDLAARYTWQYLADATAAMVDSVANAAVEAFFRLQLFKVFKTIFNSTNLVATINQAPYNVYKFYNNDGTIPPSYKNNTFAGTHNHYRTSNQAAMNAGDLDEIIADFQSHGYGTENGYRMVLMVHSQEGALVRPFKSVANGGTGTYDFIPAQGQPGVLVTNTQTLIGQGQVPATLDGLNVIGSYGPLIVVQDDWMPPGYIFAFVTGGSLSINNPIGLREHPQASLRGLRLAKGRNPDYPLIDSFWVTGFGAGVRQRGAGMVMQIVNSATYTVPTVYA